MVVGGMGHHKGHLVHPFLAPDDPHGPSGDHRWPGSGLRCSLGMGADGGGPHRHSRGPRLVVR